MPAFLAGALAELDRHFGHSGDQTASSAAVAPKPDDTRFTVADFRHLVAGTRTRKPSNRRSSAAAKRNTAGRMAAELGPVFRITGAILECRAVDPLRLRPAVLAWPQRAGDASHDAQDNIGGTHPEIHSSGRT